MAISYWRSAWAYPFGSRLYIHRARDKGPAKH